MTAHDMLVLMMLVELRAALRTLCERDMFWHFICSRDTGIYYLYLLVSNKSFHQKCIL